MCATPAVPKQPQLLSFRCIRLRTALLLMFGMFCNLTLRTNLGVTVVCMVNSTAVRKPTQARNETYDDCPSADGEQAEKNGYDGTLLWDSHLQGLMFSATSIGSYITLVPAGILADKFNAKRVAMTGLLIAGAATYALPYLAVTFAYGFLGFRFVIGMSLGIVIPPFASIASRWFVPNERSTLHAIYTSGSQFAGIFLGLVSPHLCLFKEAGGWASVYHLCASLAVLWTVLWLFFVSNYVDQSRSISEEEKVYIQSNTVVRKSQEYELFPWKAAFTSRPFLAILFVRSAAIVQQQTLQFYASSFIRDVLRLDSPENGVLVALPHVADLLPKIAFSILADELKKKNITGYTSSVRIFQAISSIGSGVCFLCLVLVADCRHVLPAVVLLTLSGAFTALSSPGAHTSALSIAPAYTGTLHAIDMLAGFLAGSAFVYVTGIALQNVSTTLTTLNYLELI
uniref:MFS domain-containing protein n=1 Tax=Steinernema glaseri TaxID=37863 RepID=A0A1I7Y3H3_9BILA